MSQAWKVVLCLQGVSLSLAGCWYTCKEIDDSETELAEQGDDGRLYRISRGADPARGYVNCEAFCAEQLALIEPKGCRVQAETIDASPDSGRKYVSVKCDGTYALCREVPSLGTGRFPDGYSVAAGGNYLARLAHSESAAVFAFRTLSRELAAHGAPASLVRRAKRAARDEVRHARLMNHAARTLRGEGSDAYEGKSLPVRPLLAVALENAREGVVHEAMGAVFNAYQSEHAIPELRRIFTRITTDETAHARLSLDVHAWCLSRLSPSEAACVRAEVRCAVRDLRTYLETSEPEDPAAGLPSRDESRMLWQALDERVWSACA